jgi:uncharacterized protein YecE (DUF72 family)
MNPSIRIGTSGWDYPHWQQVFYPPSLQKIRWLEFYASRFDTVELNAAFYRQPNAATVAKWHDRTPPGFLWAVKANRYITHIRRLRDVSKPLCRFYSVIKGLREKLGPVLMQLPPRLAFDEGLARSFLAALDPGLRHVLEVRNSSWINERVFELLAEHNVAMCIADTAGCFPVSEAVTADFIYVRLHGSRELYASKYTGAELQVWAEKIRRWGMDTYVYFDNDHAGHALQNALRLRKLLAEP